MAKVRYTLTAVEDHVKTEVIDGKTVIVFEWDCEDHYVEDADSSGNYQSDCLWEIFKHSFEAFDDDGTPVDYDPSTGERSNPTPLEEKEIKTLAQLERWIETHDSKVTSVSRMKSSSGNVLNFVNIDDRISLKIDSVWKRSWVKKWKEMGSEDFAKWITPHVLNAIYKHNISVFDMHDLLRKEFKNKC